MKDLTAVEEKARRVRLLLFDVDGVLTDGSILVHADGSESKLFSIRDGSGIVLAQRAGLRTGILSARHSPATAARAAQLAMSIVRQQGGEKLESFRDLLREEGLREEEVAFMGDDLLDLRVLSLVGLSAAPADAAPEVREQVDWVSTRAGGQGAARELVELVLRAQDRWAPLVEQFLTGAPA